MHHLEPFYGWSDLYRSENDPKSPFYGREYSEFEYTNQIYNYAIHPQWDTFGSPTLLIKIIFVSYQKQFAVIELLGEWNDCIHNDIMMLKRDIIDTLMAQGINRFVLIGENVLNFHGSDECYYEEWADDLQDKNGWVALINFRPHVLTEMHRHGVDMYLACGGELDDLAWRTYQPGQLVSKLDGLVQQRLIG